MREPSNDDQQTTEGESGTQPPPAAPLPAINSEKDDPHPRNQKHATGDAEKRNHTLLEKIAFGVAVLAASGTGYQAYVASDTEQRSLRAYIFPTDNIMRLRNDLSPDVSVTIKNVGLTPAYEFRHWACVFVRKTPNQTASNMPTSSQSLPTKNIFPDISKGIEAPATIIAPQGIKFKIIDGWCEYPFKIDGAERAEIKSGAKSMYVVGKIIYRDTFGTPRITRYSRYWNDVLGLVNDGEDGNCTDEYCGKQE